MSRAAHPEAMAPPKNGPTRTAPPQMPASWWSAPRIRKYLLFDATGAVYLVIGFLILEVVWTLGEGRDAFNTKIASFSHPLYIAFHALCLVSVIYVAVRFFSLFPKAQPRHLGAPMPPDGVIKGMLYMAWLGLTLVLSLVLAGVIF